MNDTLLWYATRGAGAVSLVLLSAVVVLGVSSVRRLEAAGWPRFLVTGLHRNLSLTAVVFLAIHIVTAVVDPFTHLGWVAAVVPFGSSYRTFWLGLGTVAVELLAAIVVTSLVRRLVTQPAWRAVHWLAYACWPMAVVHGWGTGTDSGSAWLLAVNALCMLAVAAAIGVRLLTPSPDPLAGARAGFRQRAQRSVPR
jgi:methionine sulfoxide reductase heme-binding subunit